MRHAASVSACPVACVVLSVGSCPAGTDPKGAPLQLSLCVHCEKYQPGRTGASLDSAVPLGLLPGCEGRLQERRLIAEGGSAAGVRERSSVCRDFESG